MENNFRFNLHMLSLVSWYATEKAVVNIDETELNIGLSHVAMSRVKTLLGLAFEIGFTFERIIKFTSRQLFVERKAC